MEKLGREKCLTLLLLPLLGLAGCFSADTVSESTGTGMATQTESTPYWTTPSSTSEGTATPMGDTLTVSASGIWTDGSPSDYLELSEAVLSAPDQFRILIAPGLYTQPVVIEGKTLEILSISGASETILSLGESATPTRAMTITGGAAVTLRGLTISGGSAQDCGDLSAEEEASCGGNLFVHNSSLDAQQLLILEGDSVEGGGVFIANTAQYSVNISNTSFVANSALSGGALSAYGTSLSLSHIRFQENHALGQGGCLQLDGGVTHMQNSVLMDNVAAIGGAVSLSGGLLVSNFVVFSNNEAEAGLGGAISVSDDSSLQVLGSIFSDNHAQQGADINMGCGECSADISYSTFHDLSDTDSSVGGNLEELNLGDGILDSDPLFIAPQDFRLSENSPCVDAGPPDSVDPDSSRSDMGAYGSEQAVLWDLDGDSAYQPWSESSADVWDCNDNDPAIAPGLEEACDGLDNDCNGLLLPEEADLDGDGFTLCLEPIDCDDTEERAYPGGVEGEESDGIDNDCNGQADDGTTGYDDDMDGYCEAEICVGSALPGDCDDHNPLVSPSSPESCDGLDSNCDGIDPAIEESDSDEDGHRLCDGDTDDSNASVYPGASETPFNNPDGLDNDGDGLVDEGTIAFDDDGDGYCETTSDALCSGSLGGGDCDDARFDVNPGEVERCDGVDTDCDGTVDVLESDSDGDGYRPCGFPADCNDSSDDIRPGATDIAGNGIDEDCDGWDLGTVGYSSTDDVSRLSLSCSSQGGSGTSYWAYLALIALLRPRRKL